MNKQVNEHGFVNDEDSLLRMGYLAFSYDEKEEKWMLEWVLTCSGLLIRFFDYFRSEHVFLKPAKLLEICWKNWHVWAVR